MKYKTKKIIQSKNKKNSRGTVKKYDVIISAHYNNYNTAMKIKEKIEELDLTTWTSLDKKTNDSDAWNPDAMNSTIKHCECVIICKSLIFCLIKHFSVDVYRIIYNLRFE